MVQIIKKIRNSTDAIVSYKIYGFRELVPQKQAKIGSRGEMKTVIVMASHGKTNYKYKYALFPYLRRCLHTRIYRQINCSTK